MSGASGPAVKTVGGFEVLSKIGQGAMGTVFKARQPGLDRIVALKVLPPRIASADPAFIDRFIREARVSAKLNHPNIVQGIEVGQDGPTRLYYFAMEYIDGPTVRQVLNWEKRIEERRALEIILGVANALVCAHKAGIVHRDIKPDNILLSSNGEIKVTDLGLARSISMGSGIRFHDDKDESQIIMGPSADAALTVVGAAIGTPSYMAPEAARAQEVDIRTDLYGAGATLFHMLTGTLPFKGGNAEETMKLLVTAPVPDPRKLNPNISHEAGQLVVRLMQKDPSKRLQSPEELVSELEGLLHNREAVRTSNPVIPRARRSVSKVPAKSQKSGATSQALIACVVAFVIGAAGIGLLIHNRRVNAEKAIAENTPPVPPAGKTDGDKPPETGKHEGAPTVGEIATPPKGPEAHTPDVSAKVPPVSTKPIDDQAFDVWENLVERKQFREAGVALKNFCAGNKLNDTAYNRLRSKLEDAVGERLKRLIAHARDLIDGGRPDEAVKELSGATFAPDEEDPFYRSALDDAHAAALRSDVSKPAANDLQSRWLNDVQRALRDGARKLADGRNFTLKCVNHAPYHLVKGRVDFKGLSKDEAFINLGVTEDDKVVPTLEPVAFNQLTPETRFELICLSAGDRSTQAGVLVKWAVTQFVVNGVGSAADVQKILAQAKADGAPDAVLADARTLLPGGTKASPDQTVKIVQPPPPAPVKVFNNPFNNARTNDYIDYKNGTHVLRMKVVKKDDTTATFKLMDLDTQGKVLREQPALPYPLQRDICFYDMFCPDRKIINEGEDTVTIAGKVYKCHTANVKFTDPALHKETTSRFWFCPDVPLFGLVKWEKDASTGMEFLKAGNE